MNIAPIALQKHHCDLEILNKKTKAMAPCHHLFIWAADYIDKACIRMSRMRGRLMLSKLSRDCSRMRDGLVRLNGHSPHRCDDSKPWHDSGAEQTGLISSFHGRRRSPHNMMSLEGGPSSQSFLSDHFLNVPPDWTVTELTAP